MLLKNLAVCGMVFERRGAVMGFLRRKTDLELWDKPLRCKICGKEISSKVKNKYEVCRNCTLNAKKLCEKKPAHNSKHTIIILTIVLMSALLALINILAAIKNCLMPSLVLTVMAVLLGLIFLGFSLDE